ncbi:MAG: LicD family protein [Ruaniaceae bacterium]|nr:LicD family protein [Ruaniaceae bacterium]
MAFKSYENADELRRVQLVSTKILAEFDRVCRELSIPYVAYAGTAIGAVRHHGFIPWDDDVDIAMTRADYEQFLEFAPARLGEQFSIVNSRNEPDFPSTYSYLALNSTYFIPEFYRNCAYRKPLSIDIFPLDNVPDDERLYLKQSRRTWLWGRLMFVRATPSPYLAIDGWKRSLVLAATHTAHWTMRALGITPRWIQKQWDSAARLYEGADTERMADYSDRDPLAWAVTYEDMFPALDVQFEGITVKLPRNYDAILTRGYGDYMSLPPLESRKNHYPFLIDLGEH